MLHQLARLLFFKQILSTVGLVSLSLLVVFGYLSWRDILLNESVRQEYQHYYQQQQHLQIQEMALALERLIARDTEQHQQNAHQTLRAELDATHTMLASSVHLLSSWLTREQIQTLVKQIFHEHLFDAGKGHIFILDQADNLNASSPLYSQTVITDNVLFTDKDNDINWSIHATLDLLASEASLIPQLQQTLATTEPLSGQFFVVIDSNGKKIVTSGLMPKHTHLTKTDLITVDPADLIVTYNKAIDHLGWSVLAGYYPDQFNTNLENRLEEQQLTQQYQFNNLMFGLMLLSAFVLVFAFITAYWLAKTFNEYRDEHDRQRDNLIKSKAELELAARVFDSTTEGIIISDANNQIITCNTAFTRITGYSCEDVIGKNPSFFSSGETALSVYENMWTTLQKTGHWQGEVINRHKKGYLFPEWLSINVYCNAKGDVINYIGTVSDITSRKKVQESLERLAHYDSLTNLANRRQLEEFMQKCIQQKQADWQHNAFSVMFMDLDNFKFINDSLGHATGDTVLKATAERLTQATTADDLVCRLGGDEFIIILNRHIEHDELTSTVDHILTSVSSAININGKTLTVTPSIGISRYPKDGETPATLLKNADTALYLAKENGRNRAEFFTADLSRIAQERVSLESDLRRALKEKQFELYYQPQINLQTQKLIGAEALIRWHHPHRGMVPPDRFIALAEETGLIMEIGDWVIDEAFRQMAIWAPELEPDFTLAINLSPKQFTSGLLTFVESRLSHHKIKSQRISFEITESVLMKQPDNAIHILSQLRILGISIALDDFGTGYSSLSYLKRFPLDKLKIDRSFIRDLPGNTDDITITNAIIATAKHFNLITVAEGIENAEQAEFLAQIGCQQGQGYFYAKPITAQDMRHRIHQKTTGRPALVQF